MLRTRANQNGVFRCSTTRATSRYFRRSVQRRPSSAIAEAHVQTLRMQMLRAKLKAFGPTRQSDTKQMFRSTLELLRINWTSQRLETNRCLVRANIEPSEQKLKRLTKRMDVRHVLYPSDYTEGRSLQPLSDICGVRPKTEQKSNIRTFVRNKDKGKLRTCQNRCKQTQSLRRPQNM